VAMAPVQGNSARFDFAAYDYGRNIARALPPRASLFMDGGDDTFYAMAYLSYAEGRRPDLDLHDRGGLVFKNIYGEDFRSLPRKLKEERRRELEGRVAQEGLLYYSTFNESLLPGQALRPEGLLWSTAKAGPPFSWELYPLRWEEGFLRRHYRARALIPVYPVMRAEAFNAEGNFAAGLQQLRWAWSLGADSSWIRSVLAHVLEKMGYEASTKNQWSMAEPIYEFAVVVASDPTNFLLSLGVVYEKTRRFAEAENVYRKILEKNSRSGQAYYNLGVLYWAEARWEAAAEAFARAFALKPENSAWGRFAEQAKERGLINGADGRRPSVAPDRKADRALGQQQQKQ